MTTTALRSALAALQHEIWAHWMTYQFSCCWDISNTSICAEQSAHIAAPHTMAIPGEKVERWQRQLATPYAELTTKEQASDLEQADKILALPELRAVLEENLALKTALRYIAKRVCTHSSDYAHDVYLAAKAALKEPA
jgi:hypothetical protein